MDLNRTVPHALTRESLARGMHAGACVVGLSLLALSCAAKEEAVLDTSEENPVSAAENTAGQSLDSIELRWATPAGWEVVEPDNERRARQYRIAVDGGEALDVIVYHWKSGIGGLQPNLTRWENSLTRAPEEEAPKVETVEANQVTVTLFDGRGDYTAMSGETTQAQRMLCGYLESFQRFDGVYTVQLVGDQEAVSLHADSFRNLLLNL